MIAIPDFAANAMENWGLITYRETAMLFNQEVTSEKSRQRVTIVITHELAHQVKVQRFLNKLFASCASGFAL
jgi:aminopeptidase N